MTSSRLRALATAVAAALALTFAACGTDTGEPQDRHLVVGTSVAPNSMDPTTSNAAAIPQVLLYNVYETLLKVDGDGSLQPLLASEWAVSPDGLTYTFDLRPQATFAAGGKVTADAVVTSIERIIEDPQVLPVHKTAMAPVDTVTAVDEDTVEFELKQPSNNWLYSMAQTAGIIFDPEHMDQLASVPAGSGPFVFSDWVQGDSVVLNRNDAYWGTPSKLAGVTFKSYSDANAMNAAMLSGSLDIISNVAAPQALSQFDDPRFTVLEGVTTGEVVLGMNHQVPALQDLRVRQAIMAGIDRKALGEAVWAGKGPLIGSMVPPTDPWYEDLSGKNPYDPELARQLLAEAGYAPGALTLRLRVPNLPYGPPAGAYIASQLAAVGITVQVEELEFPATWIDEVMVKSNYDMTIVAHVESRDMDLFADPSYYWHYDNPEFQELIAEADAAPADEYVALMREAAEILADDVASGFLWLLPSLVVTKADITGVHENASSLSFDMTAVVAPPA